jgi:uncharacterized protein (DUF362 family)
MKFLNELKTGRKSKILFFIFGISSTVWFLIRVIPKPSRATYPCMKATAPFMSAFILYLLSLSTSIFVFKKYKIKFLQTRFMLSFVMIAIALFSFTQSTDRQLDLVALDSFVANAPIGVAKGIHPGRVVWVHDSKAVNQSYNTTNSNNEYWCNDDNCNQTIVDSLLNAGIEEIAGESNIQTAWDTIFKYFNINHGKGDVGYVSGEKIAVKINLTTSATTQAEMNSTPQLCLSLLKQLIEVVGVKQEDIWFGDSYRPFQDVYWNKCHTVYPNVHYMDGNGNNGREQTQPSTEQLLVFSDGKETSSIPQHIANADYFINMPCLKTHNEGGITLTAKTHQGTVLNPDPNSGVNTPSTQSAMYMHPYLPGDNPGYHKYRHLVDYMGHKDLGGKTLLFIVDGIWAGENWTGEIWKWKMPPFNNQYPASLFISQDHVAIDAVCFDFLLTEYARMPASEQYPYINGTDDYLMQAADSSNWPTGIKYNPEGDGKSIGSLGVYEHWDNSTDKQYSRNLGIGDGIELYSTLVTSSVKKTNLVSFNVSVYPNPFIGDVNFVVKQTSNNQYYLSIYNLNGQAVFQTTIQNNIYTWNSIGLTGTKVKSGTYVAKITDKFSNVMACKTIICN